MKYKYLQTVSSSLHSINWCGTYVSGMLNVQVVRLDTGGASRRKTEYSGISRCRCRLVRYGSTVSARAASVVSVPEMLNLKIWLSMNMKYKYSVKSVLPIPKGVGRRKVRYGTDG